MANIRRETGRHVWRDTVLMRGFEKVRGAICMNCRLPVYDRNADRPVTGCLISIDVSRLGDARLKDHAEQEMRRRKEHDDAERAADLALLRDAGALEG